MAKPSTPGFSTIFFREICSRPPISQTPWVQVTMLKIARWITVVSIPASPRTAWISGTPMKPALP